MSKIWQECHCPKSGGGCGGYFSVGLQDGMNKCVDLVCPNCKHKHRRRIKNGQIVADGRYDGSGNIDEICPPLSAYSSSSQYANMFKAEHHGRERSGHVVTQQECVRSHAADKLIKQRWFEIFGRK